LAGQCCVNFGLIYTPWLLSRKPKKSARRRSRRTLIRTGPRSQHLTSFSSG
jgi:hypothetical protein